MPCKQDVAGSTPSASTFGRLDSVVGQVVLKTIAGNTVAGSIPVPSVILKIYKRESTMVEKALFEIYYTYGKSSGEERGHYWVEEDTREARGKAIQDINHNDTYFLEEFLEGKQNTLYFHSHGGDWDDPTGGFISISTKEDKLKELEAERLRIEKIFL